MGSIPIGRASEIKHLAGLLKFIANKISISPPQTNAMPRRLAPDSGIAALYTPGARVGIQAPRFFASWLCDRQKVD
jgi:hypothetical protein